MTGQEKRQPQHPAPRFDIRSELHLIPWWAYALAIIVYFGIQLVFHGLAWPSEPNPPAMPFQILFPLFIGIIPAFLILLIGYVNRDAGRRGMSRTMWTVIVILVPNGIGFILYFVFRNPIRAECPKCRAVVDPTVNYCPRCRYAFKPTCPQCKSAVGPGDAFCANCGTQLNEAA
jgi:hypothetical protein